MKTIFCLLMYAVGLLSGPFLQAQCTTAAINWDELDYFHRNTSAYSTYVTTTMMRNQGFALGVNRMVITIAAGITPNGETANHTAVTGMDAEFTTTSTAPQILTLTFDEPVTSLQFSLYDIDNSQQVAFAALDASGVSKPIALSKPGGASVALGGMATAPVAAGQSSGVASSSNSGTVLVNVAGPVKSITLTFSNALGDFWLSDISACVTGSFPINYYAVSRPWNGPVVNQPGYVLAVHDRNTVFYVDPATGTSISLFTDPDPKVREINNIAYDPVRRIVYYSADGVERLSPAQSPATVKSIKSYNVNTGVIATVISDVTAPPFNIPTFQSGLESGGAAFYNGSLYIGVEGYLLSGTRNSGRESIVYRIDFDASNNPVKAAQVFAQPVDNGTSNIHDWADFVMKDGLLYDYNSAGNGSYSVYNLQQQTKTVHTPATQWDKPRQAGQGWDGTLYWFSDSIGVFNGTNRVSAKRKIKSAPGSVSWVAAAGDAAEAFRPLCDFGDAPMSYDPDPLAPAVHEPSALLRLGATSDAEWVKPASANGYANADEDGADEDGLAYVTLLTTGSSYLTDVTVFNNTGSIATVVAWLDYNQNNRFDPGEGIVQNVPSSPAPQMVSLFWTGITHTLPDQSQTYLRIRITSAANGMTVQHPTGYFPDGEVEDYFVTVNYHILAAELLSFEAKAEQNRQVQLKWTSTSGKEFKGFDVQRSADGVHWEIIGFMAAKAGSVPEHSYAFTDRAPLDDRSFYRLKLVHQQGQATHSPAKTVTLQRSFTVNGPVPNPAQDKTTITVYSTKPATAYLRVVNIQGACVYQRPHAVAAGRNGLLLDQLSALTPGSYLVQVQVNGQLFVHKLLINKK